MTASAAPAIKGTLFPTVVDELNVAIESGRVDRESVERDLLPEDLDLIEQKISNIGWYDIHAYHRLVGILWGVEAAGDSGYWFQRGRRAARRLIESGIYQQLDYLGRTEASRVSESSEKFKAFGRDMKLLMTLHASMLNFGEWRCVPDPDHELRYRIEIRDVEGIPDGVFLAAAGVFTGLGEEHSGNTWRFARPATDLVLIQMQQSL